MSALLRDKELNQYRDLVIAPGTFEEGFTWRTIMGTLFVGLIMLPASMYMALMIGGHGLTEAAKWVTVILILEVAKRARSYLRPSEIFILMAMVGAFVGATPVESFFWRQYMVQSDAAHSFGLAFPDWWAPSDQAVLDSRSFFHPAWIIPLALLFLSQVVSRIDSLILGYGLFRVASDIERLPFPMAPLGASGILALSENVSGSEGWRWRTFSIGAAIGMCFSVVYALIPTISSTFLKQPFQILPIPFLDTTQMTQDLMPATATGISFDLGVVFLGMALPFWGIVGAFIGLVVTLVANPILFNGGLLPRMGINYHGGILHTWKPGMPLTQTLFANQVDFYLSFALGLGLAIAVVGVWMTIQSLREKRKPTTLDAPAGTIPKPIPAGRGDIRTWIIFASYLCSSTLYITLAAYLLKFDFKGSYLLWVLIFFAFIYVPLVSYITARLEGLAGQALSLPYVKELALILSGYKGIEVWLLPIPMTANYGVETVQYRTAELIGCSFRSIWKMALLTTPIVFISSLLYGQFIWSMGSVPSAAYPYANVFWDLESRNQALILSSTSDGYSPFFQALNPLYVGLGAGVGMLTYSVLAVFGAPILLVIGATKGLGQSTPQNLIGEMMGAMLGRYVMAKRFGAERWRRYAPVLFTGYACGFGLVFMFGTGVKFLRSAVFQLPY